MYFDDFVNGINILKEYYTDIEQILSITDNGTYCQFSTDLPIIEDDVKTLVAYGWYQLINGDHSNKFTYKDYNENEKWYAFIG